MNSQRSGITHRGVRGPGQDVQSSAPSPRGDASGFDDAHEEPAFKTLTADEARQVREKLTVVSPWRVVGVQALAGLVCAAVAWVLSHGPGHTWSALYGAATAVLPSALLAHGMTRRVSGPQSALTSFVLWESLKILLAIGMMVVAPRVVPQLSWVSFLLAWVLCMKASWVVLLWRGNKH